MTGQCYYCAAGQHEDCCLGEKCTCCGTRNRAHNEAVRELVQLIRESLEEARC
jgi:hypothetical protein